MNPWLNWLHGYAKEKKMRDMKVLSANEFRQRLAGVIAPLIQEQDKEAAKTSAISFVSILPELFSKDLDRISMWERIGNGLSAAAKKCGGNLDEFVNLSLDFIKATPGAVASNERLEEWLSTTMDKSEEYKSALIRSFTTRLNVILIYGRQDWKDRKGC